MTEPNDLIDLHEAVASALRGPDPVEAVRVLCRSAPGALSMDGCAISTMTGTRLRETVCASDRVAVELEELQFSLGEGPCFAAYDAGVPVLVPDLEHGLAPRSSWPLYASRAVERSPARAVFAFPLCVGSLRVGTMDAYRVEPGPLEVPTLTRAVELAETVALVLLGLQDPAGAVAQVQRESTAGRLGARTTGHDRVHVAAGMLAEQLHLSPDDAFDRLRGHAFVEGRLLVDVAADVLDRTLRLDGAEDGAGSGP